MLQTVNNLYKRYRQSLFILPFVVIGLVLIILVSASGILVSREAENYNSRQGNIAEISDSNASNGSFLQFGTETNPTNMPSRQEIIAGAGLTNPNALQPPSGFPITTNSKGHKIYRSSADGQVIENVHFPDGKLQISHDNVVVRNVLVETSGGQGNYGIEPTAGTSGIVIENCEVRVNRTSAAIRGSITENLTVRYCRVDAADSDGFKGGNGALFEYNYITMDLTIPPEDYDSGSNIHVDGIQGSGRRDWTVRRSVVDSEFRIGVNAAIFSQTSDRVSNPQPAVNISFIENYVSGGGAFTMRHGGITSGEVRGNIFVKKPPKDPVVSPNLNTAYLWVSNCGQISVSDNFIEGTNTEITTANGLVKCG